MDRKTHILVAIIVAIIVTIAFAILLTNSERKSKIKEELKTLKFVQVLFRHGKRTPSKVTMFPTDPYWNYTNFPLGIGALTNKGKQQMYNIGKYLRHRYDGFLSDYYLPNEVIARTADLERTQMSLQLVLTGLYPPKGEQIWENLINWQPIPYKCLPLIHDIVFESHFCPAYQRLYFDFMNTAENLKEYQRNKKFFDYVSVHTGWNITTPGRLYIVYDRLSCDENLALNWTKQIYPNKMREWATIAMETYCGTDKLKRLHAGYLLKHLIQEIQAKINNKLDTKFSLYSGHDVNVNGIGGILNLFEYHVPPFSATITIELHQTNDKYTVKFKYQACDPFNPKIVKPLYNETIFDIDELLKFVEPYLPEDSECEKDPEGLDFEVVY